VHSNTKEAEDTLVNMNNNVWAFLSFLLVDRGMKQEFVDRLLEACCDPTLKHSLLSTNGTRRRRG